MSSIIKGRKVKTTFNQQQDQVVLDFYNSDEFVKLKDLLICTINNSTQYCSKRKKIMNDIIRQSENESEIVTITLENNERGIIVLQILSKFAKKDQKAILCKIIEEEYLNDLSNHTIIIKSFSSTGNNANLVLEDKVVREKNIMGEIL